MEHPRRQPRTTLVLPPLTQLQVQAMVPRFHFEGVLYTLGYLLTHLGRVSRCTLSQRLHL